MTSDIIAFATLVLDGWQGYFKQQVGIVGETPKKYRIVALNRTRLNGRNRYLEPGQTTLVPKHAIRAAVAKSK